MRVYTYYIYITVTYHVVTYGNNNNIATEKLPVSTDTYTSMFTVRS